MANKSESGFEECMSITRILMSIVGVWPLEKAIVWPMCKFLSLIIPLIFLNIIPQTAKVIQAHDDYALVVEVLTVADINEFISLVKTLTLWYHRVDLKKLIVQIRRDWETASIEEQREMWSRARTTKWILRFFVFSFFGLASTYYSLFFFTLKYNVTYVNGTAIRPLYMNAYFPFDFHRSPVYEVITIGQWLGGTLSVIVFIAFDGLFVSSILHFSSQFHNLKQRLEYLVNEHRRTTISFASCLKPVIQRHLQLISHVNIIESSFNKAFLVQIFMISIALCLEGYQFVMLLSEMDAGFLSLIFTLFYTMINLSSIFAYCAIAQIIRDESESLLDGIHQMEWYRLPARDAIMIVILMRRYARPFEITVGKFSPLTLEYFTSVMKTSFGYLSMLLAVKGKVIE